MGDPRDYLGDDSPLITAAYLGKLRLVRMLVDGGAQVNERNQRGETPLLAACKAKLRGEQTSSPSLRLLQYLLDNRADPNSQDKAGRTALMYACMGRAGPEVATVLVQAGADPSMEDYTGASSLVYAINARDQATLQVLLDACREGGRDIIIIATELSAGGRPITRRYLNVLPSPDTSPVSCMSPSEIELKTGSPGSEAEAGGTVFDFRATGSGEEDVRRLRSEPCLAIHNLAHLRSSYTEGNRRQEVTDEEDETEARHFLSPEPPTYAGGRRWSLHALGGQAWETCEAAKGRPSLGRPPRRGPPEKLSLPSNAPFLGRRNTLPALQDQHLLQLPSLTVPRHTSDSQLRAPSPGSPGSSESGVMRKFPEPPAHKSPARIGFLPPIPASATQPLAAHGPPEATPRGGQQGRRSRRHSIQLERDDSQDVLTL
ncbi:ankyrin repeat domain-containing protein 34B [Paramormyrops kingsleyae]|uniref:Ankyrin repeat domain-containing protein 34B-like n=1 Tax=Paramormyrops kingsleyae TaxID=1676925 RepID=A0A3B3S9W6_9TELE|nr:ankyrin repeat domain-containing protein 34B-like [Paramormyrops kingsleyae]XP_023653758.1 ankyrin repeat domain-containing protein 34B-like [Paramormyrops kingsleyae]